LYANTLCSSPPVCLHPGRKTHPVRPGACGSFVPCDCAVTRVNAACPCRGVIEGRTVGAERGRDTITHWVFLTNLTGDRMFASTSARWFGQPASRRRATASHLSETCVLCELSCQSRLPLSRRTRLRIPHVASGEARWGWLEHAQRSDTAGVSRMGYPTTIIAWDIVALELRAIARYPEELLCERMLGAYLLIIEVERQRSLQHGLGVAFDARLVVGDVL